MKSYLRIALAVMLTVWVFVGIGKVQGQLQWESLTTENAANLVEVARLDLGQKFNHMAYSPNGATLALATNDGIQLLDLSGAGNTTDLLNEPQMVLSLAYHPDGSLLAFSGFKGDSYGVHVVDTATGEEKYFIEVLNEVSEANELNFISEVIFHPQGNLLVYVTNTLVFEQSFEQGMSGFKGVKDGAIHVVDYRAQTEVFTLPHDEAVMGMLYFTPDGAALIATTMDMTDVQFIRGGTAHRYALKDGSELGSFETKGLAAAFTPDGARLATTKQITLKMGSQLLWAWGSPEQPVLEVSPDNEAALLHTFEFDEAFVIFNDSAFNADGTVLAAVSVGPFEANKPTEARLHLWDVENKSDLLTLVLGETLLASLEVSPAGTHLATWYRSLTNNHDIVQVWAVMPQGVCTVAANNTINLRGGPGTSYDVVGSLAGGAEAYVGGQTTGSDNYLWYQLLTSAWVRSDLVTPVTSCEDVPEVTDAVSS